MTKLNSTGTALLYSTYLGGSGEETPYDGAIDSQGVIAVSGATASTNFPTSDPIQATNGDGGTLQDAYITQINPAVAGAAGLQMSTYFGGSGSDTGYGIAVDSSFALAVTGQTNSTNLSTKSPKQPSIGGGSDAFVARLAVSGRTLQHTYDGLQRLIGTVELPGSTYAYGYDLAGNRTSVAVNGAAPVITTYNLDNQITNAGYTYDLVGNLTNDGTTSATFDALNRMATRGTTTNGYNGDGALVSQITGGVTTRYTQDLASPLTQVLQSFTGATRSEYLYGANRLATQTGAVRMWYASDALGSVRRTVSDAGVPQGVINYDPWGTVESGSVPTFGFTGELQQGGNVYLRARWYNSGQGRFGSRDPFAGVGEQPYSLHPYAYVLSNPMLFTDPTGNYYTTGNEDPSGCPAGYVFDPTQYHATHHGCIPVNENTAPPNWYPADIGIVVGATVGCGVGPGGNAGIETVYDLYDFEVDTFIYGNIGPLTALGGFANAYIGLVTGWKDFSFRGVANYKGYSVGGGIGFAGFSAQGGMTTKEPETGARLKIFTLGAGISGGIKLTNVPSINKAINTIQEKIPGFSGGVGLFASLEDILPNGFIQKKQEFHANNTRPTIADARRFITHLARSVDPTLAGAMAAIILYNGIAWDMQTSWKEAHG